MDNLSSPSCNTGINFSWLVYFNISAVIISPSYPTPPILPSDFALYLGVQIIKTYSFSLTDFSMKLGNWAPGTTSQRSSLASMPLSLKVVANFLTQDFKSSLSHAYDINALGADLSLEGTNVLPCAFCLSGNLYEGYSTSSKSDPLTMVIYCRSFVSLYFLAFSPNSTNVYSLLLFRSFELSTN